MKNGSAFTAYIEKCVADLDGVKVLDYYSQSLPSALDETIEAMMVRFVGETAVHQAQFQAALPKPVRSLLAIFGHRAATLAARNLDVDILKLGLMATAVSNYEIPESRSVSVGLAIFYHVARKLEQNPVDLFKDVAQVANDDMKEALLKFGRDGRISLANFGWKEIKTDEGVIYKWG